MKPGCCCCPSCSHRWWALSANWPRRTLTGQGTAGRKRRRCYRAGSGWEAARGRQRPTLQPPLPSPCCNAEPREKHKTAGSISQVWGRVWGAAWTKRHKTNTTSRCQTNGACSDVSLQLRRWWLFSAGFQPAGTEPTAMLTCWCHESEVDDPLPQTGGWTKIPVDSELSSLQIDADDDGTAGDLFSRLSLVLFSTKARTQFIVLKPNTFDSCDGRKNNKITSFASPSHAKSVIWPCHKLYWLLVWMQHNCVKVL